LRYLRGGAALSKSGWDKLRQRNRLKTPQNPPRHVHALLACAHGLQFTLCPKINMRGKATVRTGNYIVT